MPTFRPAPTRPPASNTPGARGRQGHKDQRQGQECHGETSGSATETNDGRKTALRLHSQQPTTSTKARKGPGPLDTAPGPTANSRRPLSHLMDKHAEAPDGPCSRPPSLAEAEPGLGPLHHSRAPVPQNLPAARRGLGTWAILLFSPGAAIWMEEGFSAGCWVAWSQVAESLWACWARR